MLRVARKAVKTFYENLIKHVIEFASLQPCNFTCIIYIYIGIMRLLSIMKLVGSDYDHQPIQEVIPNHLEKACQTLNQSTD